MTNLTEKLNHISYPHLPTISSGSAHTVEDFWNIFVEPLLPQKEYVIKWDQLLSEYVLSPDAVFALRGYNSVPKGEYHKLRRGFLTRTNSGYSFFYTDNFFAAYFCKMAIDGYIPTLNEFNVAFKSRKFPSRFGRITTEEKQLMSVHQGKDPQIQSSGYKIAHIIPVGKNYHSEGKNKNIKQILDEYFPAGEREDWKATEDKNGRFYERFLEVEPIAKKYIMAHFLRFVHPFNYFLAPKKNMESNQVSNEIAEYPQLLEYAKYQMMSKYGDLYKRYLDLIMTDDLLFDNQNSSDIIDITWGCQCAEIAKNASKKRGTCDSFSRKKEAGFPIAKSIDYLMAFEYLTNSQCSYRKLEMEYLNIDSPERGGGFKAKKALNNLGILAEHKGIFEGKSLNYMLQNAQGDILKVLKTCIEIIATLE